MTTTTHKTDSMVDRRPFPAVLSCLLSLAVLMAGGCSSSESPELKVWRSKYLLSQEPSGAVTIEEARKGTGEVSIVGQVALIDVDPFVEGQAAFAISEAPDPNHGHKSVKEISYCPVCRRKALTAPTASIEFADDKGSPLNIDSRKLFNLKEGQIVVVKGEGKFDEKLNVFKVKPTGMYVRK